MHELIAEDEHDRIWTLLQAVGDDADNGDGLMAFIAIIRIVILMEKIRDSLDLIEVRTKSPASWNQP